MNIVKRQKTLIFLTFSLFLSGCAGQKNEAGDAADYWRKNQNFDMILLTEKGENYLTEGLADKFELEPDYGDMKVEQIKEIADHTHFLTHMILAEKISSHSVPMREAGFPVQ